jgi:hypothetical protein
MPDFNPSICTAVHAPHDHFEGHCHHGLCWMHLMALLVLGTLLLHVDAAKKKKKKGFSAGAVPAAFL